MTEADFALLTSEYKWSHIWTIMDAITQEEAVHEATFQLRRRYNPHHSHEQVIEEIKVHKKEPRKRRVAQYEKWLHVKSVYATYRDELANTLGNAEYENCRNILERIFTEEVDEALRGLLSE